MATRHGTFKLANELYQRKGDDDTSQKKSSVQTTLISKNNHAATSALFGTEHEGSHSNYMNAKVAKLRQVQDKHVEFLNQNNTLAKIFKGLFFYINGRQHLQLVALKQLILQRGGMVETYHTDIVTHMVCQELSESKAQKLREQYLKKNFPVQVIRSEWITDSIDAGKCLPIEMYKPTCVDETGTDQQKITSFVKKSIINNNNNKKYDVNNNCNNNNSSSNSNKSNNNNRNNSGKKNNGDVSILPTTMPNISSPYETKSK